MEGFGLERMRALLAELGEPQAGCPPCTSWGRTASRRRRAWPGARPRGGIRAGAYLSPHVRSWAERIRVAGTEVDLEPALARPSAAERLEATQFEALTAAALVAFREAGVEAAVVEAGLGGRHDATNVLDATRVVVLTNVSLEHTEVLGTRARRSRREARSRSPRLHGRARRGGVGGRGGDKTRTAPGAGSGETNRSIAADAPTAQ